MSAGYDNGSCDLFEQIRALYSELALHPEKDFGWGKGKENALALGYNHNWLEGLPDAVWESSSAVGNPFSCGPIHPGETVIDLGCGSGTFTTLLARAGYHCVGLDISAKLLEVGRRTAPAR